MCSIYTGSICRAFPTLGPYLKLGLYMILYESFIRENLVNKYYESYSYFKFSKKIAYSISGFMLFQNLFLNTVFHFKISIMRKHNKINWVYLEGILLGMEIQNQK